MRALATLESLAEPQKAKAWLLTIAYRIFIDSYRKTARRRALMPETQPALNQTVPSHGLTLDLSRAMAALPDDARACVMLVLSEGMTHSEAAQVTNLPLGTVKSHVARGRKTLQSALSAYDNKVSIHAP